MADDPGHWCPPAFYWNVGMVMHVLKGDPTLRNLEHVQVDGPGVAYLFFFNKQRTEAWCFSGSWNACGRGVFWVDFLLCPFHRHSTPTGGRLASGSGHFRKAPAKVQGRTPRPPYTQSDLQWVGFCTAVGGECPNFHGASGPNQGDRRWLHP